MNSERKEKIIERIGELAILLGGTMAQLVTANSVGKSSKKIVIEYDHETK